ncbi:MAG TPA: D-glycerate dehydrogenase [Elusimicrobiota bacterium]|nr:D-glycerate dehydrogenase [Elusimicrobiota bacterium]
MSKNVYVTRLIPDHGLDLLKKFCDKVDMNPHDRPLTRRELLKAIQGRDAVLTQLVDKIDSEALAAARGVKIIANYAVGFDNIDLPAATAQGVFVSNTPGVLTDTTAEMAWSLLFSVSRRIVEGDKMMRDGEFKGWAPLLLLGQDISNKTLGIVGAGRIGTAMAMMSKGFNMRVLYWDKMKNESLEKELGARQVNLDTLLQESDVVSLHVNMTGETRHLIDKEQFERMKPTAVLINTSRGPVINEKALVEALKSGRIFGAGLDVYEKEPSLTPGLERLPNVVLAPHIASATVETRTKMAILAAENILAALQGKRPPSLVNTEVWKG